MAKEKKIILFLSTLSIRAKEQLRTKDRVTGDDYKCPDGEIVQGLQTNEAPVKYLLKKYSDVSEILCLVTPACLEAPAGEQTAWERFCETIQGTGSKAECTLIRFSEENPSQESVRKILPNILNRTNQGDEILLETTGGFRNAMMYLMLISRALSYKGVETSCAVYSNLQTKEVEDVTEMLRVFDLIDGMQNLTSFGNVRKLQKYYENSKDEKIKTLLTVSNQLWEYITLCRPNLVSDPIKAFNQALDAAADCDDPLLRALLPAFRATFGNEMTIVHLIRWCANNDMIQQALTLYRERIPAYIMNERTDILAVKPDAQPLNMKQKPYKIYKTELEARFYVDFLKMGSDWYENHHNNQPACNEAGKRQEDYLTTLLYFEEALKEKNSEFSTGSEKKLRDVTMDYMYIHILRNMVDHADEQAGPNKQALSVYLHSQAPDKYILPEKTTVEDVRNAILNALDNLEFQTQTP
ncbi:MAG: TM1812 family CRISPR-associated protein [Clostridiales bacterium]|nr:TM1812 family CRISPR-associated protein [Clostridiales bacterium]